MFGRRREESIIDESTLIGHEDGWQDAPVWDADFLAKVQANFHNLTAEEVEALRSGLGPEAIATEGLRLQARLDELLAVRQRHQ